ncbi:MAG: STAS domain-containing protein [Gemmatimonadales bacterium]|nr:STAS domain-containing protein [Gemmatimonadales bacterium]
MMAPDDTRRIALPMDLTIANVAALHAELCDQLARPWPLTVAAGGVDRADAIGLQLLTAAAEAARGRGQRLTLESPSAALLEAARALGLEEALGLAATPTPESAHA